MSWPPSLPNTITIHGISGFEWEDDWPLLDLAKIDEPYRSSLGAATGMPSYFSRNLHPAVIYSVWVVCPSRGFRIARCIRLFDVEDCDA